MEGPIAAMVRTVSIAPAQSGRRATLALLVALTAASLSAACASTGATPRPFPVPGGRNEEPARAKPARTPLALRGSPYRNGGADPSGFDCSGFTQYVYGQYGITLPRAVVEQYKLGQPVATGHLAAGDLLFFSTVAAGPTHVGIALGGDEFVHAPSSAGVVRVEHLSGAYWSTRFLGARRVAGSGE